MTDYSDWKYIFTSSWCPVSGEIPGAPNSFESEGSLSKDPLDRLGLVIEESRRLLQVYPFFPFDILEYDDKRPNMTKEEYHKAYLNDIKEAAVNAPSVTLGYIRLIRSIYSSTRSIYQYRDYCEDEQRFTKKLIDSARDIFPRETPGFVILAVIAIKEAYQQAYNLVIYGKIPDPEKAFHLLRAAEKMAAEDDYVNLENQIQEIEPLADAHEKQISPLLEANKSKSEHSKDFHEIIILWAERLRIEKTNTIKDSEVSNIIIKRMLEKKFTPDEIDTVRYGVWLNRKTDRDSKDTEKYNYFSEDYPGIPSPKTIQNILSKNNRK